MNALGRSAIAPLRVRLWRTPMYALLWGVGVASLEMSTFAFERLGLSAALTFVPTAAPHWIVAGLVLVGFAMFVAPRFSLPVVFAITVLVLAPLMGLIAHVLNDNLPLSILSILNNQNVFGSSNARAMTPLLYYVWPAMVYGGLFIAAWMWLERSERTRRLLANAELARNSAEEQLGQAQLQALQGQVDPALLMRVLAEVQQRYRGDPPAADRLLDLLVAFLRAAMPAVRSGSSTLADEVTLLRAYVALSEQLEGNRVRWELRIDSPPPGLSFPPLRLLPLVERLVSRAPDTTAVSVVMHCDVAAVRLELHGATPGWRDEALEYPLRVGLQGLFGNAWSLDVRDPPVPGQAALTLRLSLRTDAPTDPAAERSCSPARPREGDAPWTSPATTTT